MKGRTLVAILGAAVLLTLTALIAAPLAVLCSFPSSSSTSPPLGQGLPASFRDADAAFAARVAEAFPPGSSEDALIRRLRTEGFEWTPSGPVGAEHSESQRASITRSGSACILTWRVRWGAQAARIVSAAGDYGGTCL